MRLRTAGSVRPVFGLSLLQACCISHVIHDCLVNVSYAQLLLRPPLWRCGGGGRALLPLAQSGVSDQPPFLVDHSQTLRALISHHLHCGRWAGLSPASPETFLLVEQHLVVSLKAGRAVAAVVSAVFILQLRVAR